MLNCCIERKKAREALLADTLARGEQALKDLDQPDTSATKTKPETGSGLQGESSRPSSPQSNSSDEEFFECDLDNEAASSSSSSATKTDHEKKDPKRRRTESESGQLLTRSSGSKSSQEGEDSQDKASSRPRSDSGANPDEPTSFTDSWTHQAEGRLKPFEDQRLLNVNEVMYVPVTQEPSPMTEDMLEEHAEVLAK